jgi:hypothetical protein
MPVVENWQVAVALISALIVAACAAPPAGPELLDQQPTASPPSNPPPTTSTQAATTNSASPNDGCECDKHLDHVSHRGAGSRCPVTVDWRGVRRHYSSRSCAR